MRCCDGSQPQSGKRHCQFLNNSSSKAYHLGWGAAPATVLSMVVKSAKLARRHFGHGVAVAILPKLRHVNHPSLICYCPIKPKAKRRSYLTQERAFGASADIFHLCN